MNRHRPPEGEKFRGRHGDAVQPPEVQPPGVRFADPAPAQHVDGGWPMDGRNGEEPDVDPRGEVALVANRLDGEAGWHRRIRCYPVELDGHSRLVLAEAEPVH